MHFGGGIYYPTKVYVGGGGGVGTPIQGATIELTPPQLLSYVLEGVSIVAPFINNQVHVNKKSSIFLTSIFDA